MQKLVEASFSCTQRRVCKLMGVGTDLIYTKVLMLCSQKDGCREILVARIHIHQSMEEGPPPRCTAWNRCAIGY